MIRRTALLLHGHNTLTKALENVKTVLENPTAAEGDYASAIKTLLDAYGGLTIDPNTPVSVNLCKFFWINFDVREQFYPRVCGY